MRIRATVLVPVLAVVAVAALVSIGIAVHDASQSDSAIVLVDSVSQSTESTAPATSASTPPDLTGEAVPTSVAGAQRTGGPSIAPTPISTTTSTEAESNGYGYGEEESDEESDEETDDEALEPEEEQEYESEEIEDD